MNTLTPHQLAALDFSRHISLTANAGSGKTFVLSRRYLEIALSENISLRNIAAITFTDKAASELYKKIAVQVETRIEQSTDSAKMKKLETIRRQLVSANISTIHSFCIDILREFPVEAGLDAGFSPIDERLSTELIELSVEELIKSSLNNSTAADDLKYLIRIFASKRLFASELISLIKNRKNVLTLAAELYTKPVEDIADRFYSQFQSLLTEIIFRNKEKIITDLNEINETVLADTYDNDKALIIRRLIYQFQNETDAVKMVEVLNNIKATVCTSGGSIYNKSYLKKESRSSIESACRNVENYFRELPSFQVENHRSIELELAVFGKKIIYFFNAALEIYNSRKKENGFLDYEDILLFTQKILGDENVRGALYQKYKYIMIDEYQDTNEIQYQIFLPILDYLKKGNLFVVGDEKQSIYMFRDAELEIFNRTRNQILDQSSSNKLLNLPDSFRMAPELCLFTNYIFKKLFSNPDPLYNEVEHSDLVSARENPVEGKVEILIAGKDDESAYTEAELVSKRILKLMTEIPDFEWRSIAILCRKRKSFTELEKIFIQHEIPFIIVGGKGFYQRQIIYDIYNYFSFLLDPQNDTALVGILRSPFFSISDAEIFEISRQPGKYFWNKISAGSLTNPKYVSVVETLKNNLALANNLDITSMLRKILNDSEYLAVTASKPNGQQELANISKLITLTININAQGFHTLYDYVNFLKESINQTEDESQAGLADDSNSVRIMTLHQAKGLEFPAVFLYKCEEASKNSQAKSKTVHANKNFGLLTKLPLDQNYFGEYKSAPLIEMSNYISNKKNIAEIKRLFYVGITRAMDYLFISAGYKKDLKYSKNSFMGLLQQGLQNELCEEEIILQSELEFLKKKDDGYDNISETIKFSIPVIYEIPSSPVVIKNQTEYEIKNLLLQSIKDIPEGEIISATKVAVYKQCPLKYKLTYELGYLPLYGSYKAWLKEAAPDNYEFNDREDEPDSVDENEPETKGVKKYGDLKGRIIHRVLQQEIPTGNLREYISGSIKNELNIFEFDNKLAGELEESIYSDIKNYYSSESFSFIKAFANYKNEFEIYVKENDYYLYGIIDKLIFDKDKAIIIDYKTDDIKTEEITERADAYLTQLKFYSYIVNRFLPHIREFEIRLIFIKHPDNPVIKLLKGKDILSAKNEIEEMVSTIRNNNFIKNIKHCRKCSYALNFLSCVVTDYVD